MPANREYHYRQMEQTDVSKTYADNLDAICILFMCFPPEKSHLDGKNRRPQDKLLFIYWKHFSN